MFLASWLIAAYCVEELHVGSLVDSLSPTVRCPNSRERRLATWSGAPICSEWVLLRPRDEVASSRQRPWAKMADRHARRMCTAGRHGFEYLSEALVWHFLELKSEAFCTVGHSSLHIWGSQHRWLAWGRRAGPWDHLLAYGYFLKPLSS